MQGVALLTEADDNLLVKLMLNVATCHLSLKACHDALRWATAIVSVSQEGPLAAKAWFRIGQALEYTLHGIQPRNGAWPVCHISGYEAEAYARWLAARLRRSETYEKCQQAPTPAPTTRSPQGGGARDARCGLWMGRLEKLRVQV